MVECKVLDKIWVVTSACKEELVTDTLATLLITPVNAAEGNKPLLGKESLVVQQALLISNL